MKKAILIIFLILMIYLILLFSPFIYNSFFGIKHKLFTELRDYDIPEKIVVNLLDENAKLIEGEDYIIDLNKGEINRYYGKYKEYISTGTTIHSPCAGLKIYSSNGEYYAIKECGIIYNGTKIKDLRIAGTKDGMWSLDGKYYIAMGQYIGEYSGIQFGNVVLLVVDPKTLKYKYILLYNENGYFSYSIGKIKGYVVE